MSLDSVASSSTTFEQFLKAMKPKLKRLLAARYIPVEDAEDVLQQALLALVERWDKVRDPESWLLGTLKRHCSLYWRNQRRQLHSAVDAALLECLSQPVAPAQQRSDLRNDLRQMIERLPPRCRMLLELRFQLGYDQEEIAARLGYRGSSIGKITHRCLEALAREMVGAAAAAGGNGAAREGAPVAAVGGYGAYSRNGAPAPDGVGGAADPAPAVAQTAAGACGGCAAEAARARQQRGFPSWNAAADRSPQPE
jgi:RNA polymerase sigma factor (sigma-70 family)